MTDNDVQLYMYDVTLGWAQPLSWFLVGKRLEAVWHTSIVVFEKEFHFGRGGIITSTPGETDFGKSPYKIVKLGKTNVPEKHFYDYLAELQLDEFAPEKYSLHKFNCNTFTNVLSEFLVGEGIPDDILQLPYDIINGGLNRIKDASDAYIAYRTNQIESSKNQKVQVEENSGSSWFASRGAVAAMATAGAALSSFMNEEKQSINRSRALDCRYDSDTD